MTIHGKIVAILNLAGLIAFLVLASMDFAKQQEWKYANFRAEHLKNGLPFDRAVLHQNGQPLADVVGPMLEDLIAKDATPEQKARIEESYDPGRTLKELFPEGATDRKMYVNTQVKEVERIKRLIDADLEKTKDKTEHLVRLSHYLLPLTDLFQEREELLAIRVNLADVEKAKALKTALQQGVRPGLEKVKEDLKNIPEADASKRRPFEQAYLESVEVQGGLDKVPLVARLLKILPRGEKQFAQAFADMGATANEEAFLRFLRNEPGKSFQEIFDSAYDEMLTTLDARLKQRLEDHFQAATAGQRRPPPAPNNVKKLAGTYEPNLNDQAPQKLLSPLRQQKTIGRLLLNLVEVLPGTRPQQPAKFLWDDPRYKRVINVLGLKTFGQELEDQARRNQTMIREANYAISRDHNNFSILHKNLLAGLQARASQSENYAGELKRQEDKANDLEMVVKRRQRDVDEYVKELDEARKKTADRLAEIRRMSEGLFKVRIQVRDATRLNREYERRITALEDRVK